MTPAGVTGPQKVDRWARLYLMFELGRLLFLRDYRIRARQTYLGSVWLVSQPLLSFLPVVLVVSQLGLVAGKDPKTYALHGIAGLLLWQMFWDGFYNPQWLARRVRGLLSEAAIPLESVLVASSGYALFNACVYLALLVVAYASLGMMPPVSALAGMLATPLMILAGLAFGVFLVPVSFVYLDVRFGLPLLAPALMWSAPILYDTPASGPLHWVNLLSPLTYLVNTPRHWLTVGWQVNDGSYFVAMALAGLLLTAGLRFFRRAMPRALECLPHR